MKDNRNKIRSALRHLLMDSLNDTLSMRGTVEFILRDKDGNVKVRDVYDNGITTLGYDLWAQLLAGSGGDKLSHIGIGWGAGAGDAFDAADTDLQGASKDRQAATYEHTASTAIFTMKHTWGVDEPIAGPVGIEECGIFNHASAGTMFSRLVRSILNKLATDTLEIVYKYTMSNP